MASGAQRKASAEVARREVAAAAVATRKEQRTRMRASSPLFMMRVRDSSSVAGAPGGRWGVKGSDTRGVG